MAQSSEHLDELPLLHQREASFVISTSEEHGSMGCRGHYRVLPETTIDVQMRGGLALRLSS